MAAFAAIIAVNASVVLIKSIIYDLINNPCATLIAFQAVTGAMEA